MESKDAIASKTFNVDLSSDGVSKLRNRVKEKLREFMDDYIDEDETLVDYVIVLLRNGRDREEARNELDVFLGDDCYSFVYWLWDHLDSNLNLYVQHHGACTGQVRRTMSMVGEEAEGDDSQHLKCDLERVKESHGSRYNREWKGIERDVDDPHPLGISHMDHTNSNQNTLLKVRHVGPSSSSKHPVQRNRDRHHEQQDSKGELVSQVTISAPRRLLQSAVRDALEPKLKRLRSIVFTSTSESLIVPTQPIGPVVRVSNSTVTDIKPVAVAEAVEGLNRVKLTSVFDRLGPNVSETETGGLYMANRERGVLNGEKRDTIYMQEPLCTRYIQRDHDGSLVLNMTKWDTGTGLDPDAVSDNGFNMMGNRQLNVSYTKSSSSSKPENSALTRCNLTNNADGDDLMRKARNMEEQQAFNGDNSRKIWNSVDANTWKPDHHKEEREVAKFNGKNFLQGSEIGASAIRIVEEEDNPLTDGHEHAKSPGYSQKESQKPPSSSASLSLAVCPTEDADSRTIFVTNVHFAATEGCLSHHFNKFGEVLKVTLAVSASGQPTGAACIEFMRKQSAENALSLDGTSFMSRILKVTRRAAWQEASPITAWPHHIVQSPYTAATNATIPFHGAVPGAFWHRPYVISGARSLQWKRDAMATPGDGGASIFNDTSSTARSLSYTRTDLKPDGKLEAT